jgi:uncharacterized protein YjlB
MALDTYTFDDDGSIPNSALPVLVYHAALDPADGAAAYEQRFARHGWLGAWRDGIFPYHHFHSTAHEVLGIACGTAGVMLGGPQGRRFELSAGDVIVLPAGTGHSNTGSSADLLVVGAYPNGMRWDVRRGDPAERDEVLANLAQVPLPDQDPVAGAGGQLLKLWSSAAA